MKRLCTDCLSKLTAKKHFMVTEELWEKYGVGKNYLCMPCFEKRINRKLEKGDLIKWQLNEDKP